MDVADLLGTDTDDWDLVARLLPNGWQAKARELGALRRANGFASSDVLLRTLLIHLAHGCSLRETAVRARCSSLVDVSDVAIWKRLLHCAEWFRWMSVELMREWVEVPISSRLLQRFRVRAVDATVVCEPGKTGSTWRLHYSVELSSLRCDHVEVTGQKGGETFKRFPVKTGDLLLADRAYSNCQGIGHVVSQGGHVLVRLHLTNLPLRCVGGGRPFDLLARLRKLRIGQTGDWDCLAGPAESSDLIPGRVCAVKKSAAAAAAARAKLRREASKEGRVLNPATHEAAGYFFVFTTLPRGQATADQILEYYRGRWQVELVFKRMKSLMELGHLPKHDDESSRAWLHGKLLVAFLVESLIRAGESFFPWGYPLDCQADP